jgi:hypothetical protein
LKNLTQILLVCLFLLQGTNLFNGLVLGTLLCIISIEVIINKGKLKLPLYFIIALCVYSVFLVIGIVNFHEKPFIDIKFQIFSFLLLFWLINNRYSVNLLKLLFLINGIIFIIYLLLFFDLIPNIWSYTTFGFKGRVYGPAIISINLLLFYYLVFSHSVDKKIILATILGFIYTAMTTNFMNLAVLIILSTLVFVHFKSLLKPVYMFSLLLIMTGVVWFLNSSFVPELVIEKLKYVYNPLEYPSLKTRVEDLAKALKNENFGIFKQIFGEGFGTHSEIYRHNLRAVSWSRVFRFQEIDNGFYYLYHRGGWVLLTTFILSHLYLLSRINQIKAKIGFFAIVFLTNVLSIHYFNYYFYLFIPFFIINKLKISEKYNKEVL